MSITQSDKIDFIGTDKITSEVIMTISDHLDWEDEKTHLQALQDKLNSYIEFVEGGQIFEDFPDYKGKKIVIEIISEFEYNDEGKQFLEAVKPIIKSIGAEIQQRVLEE